MTPIEIAEKIIADNTTTGCAAVFDLDSTLFCVSPRSQAILRDLAKEPSFQARFPEAAKVLAEIEVKTREYGIKTTLTRTGLSATPELLDAVRGYWRKFFFSNSHLRHDLIYPGANDFVNYLYAKEVPVYYLTGRGETKMRDGTMAGLKSWRFPDVPLERVMMKPSDLETDENFKVLRLREMQLHHKKIWLFENEPLIIHEVRRHLPDVQIVFIDSNHSGKADPPTDLLTLKMDFRF